MRLRRVLWLAGGGVVLLPAVGSYLSKHGASGAKRHATEDFAVMATPPGVTLTALGTPPETNGLTHLRTIAEFLGNGATVFSDANNRTYYTSDADKVPD